MARESWSSRRDLRSGEFGRFQSHRGRIKVYMLGRGLVCLIGAVFAAEALIVDRDPGRARGYMSLIEGVDGVETTSLAVSPEGSLIATTDTAGGLSVRDHTLDWQILGSRNGSPTSCAERIIGSCHEGSVLAERVRSGHGHQFRERCSPLENPFGTILPDDRGAFVRYERGRFLTRR
jgi:hypothetical protein